VLDANDMNDEIESLLRLNSLQTFSKKTFCSCMNLRLSFLAFVNFSSRNFVIPWTKLSENLLIESYV
jgi:hypothetical protein